MRTEVYTCDFCQAVFDPRKARASVVYLDITTYSQYGSKRTSKSFGRTLDAHVCQDCIKRLGIDLPAPKEEAAPTPPTIEEVMTEIVQRCLENIQQ